MPDPLPRAIANIRLRPLTREQAAAYCGFVVSTFDAWIRQELLPRASTEEGQWHQEAISTALERAAGDGQRHGSTSAERKAEYTPLPNVHRTVRVRSDGTKNYHYYRRSMPGRLPGNPGSPEFMLALIAKEREFALRHQNQSAKVSPPSPQNSEPHHAASPIVPHSLSRPLVTRPHALSEIRPVPRRGLSREEAAMYVGVSAGKFDELVHDHRMPAPRRIDRRKVWDRHEIDVAFDALPSENPNSQGSTWDDFRAP
jgi:excisionase family DNA binding protein